MPPLIPLFFLLLLLLLLRRNHVGFSLQFSLVSFPPHPGHMPIEAHYHLLGRPVLVRPPPPTPTNPSILYALAIDDNSRLQQSKLRRRALQHPPYITAAVAASTIRG